MLLILRWLVALVVVLLFAVSVAPLVETQWWAVRLLAFPRLPETIVIVIAILLVPLLIRGRLLLLLGVEAVAVAALAINIWTLWAYSPLQSALSRSCSPQARLSVMIANVQLGNRESGPLIDMVEQQKPDLFLAMETDEWWDDKLKVLAKTMPNATQKITGSYYGMNLFSRFPLVSPQIRFLANQDTPAIDTGVTLPTGETIRFLGMHPRPPLLWQSADHRDAQLYAAGLLIKAGSKPTVVAGDLNATPWEIAVDRLRRIAGLIDPRRGYGYVATFNAKSWWEKWPLDQIFHSTGFTTLSLKSLGAFGSDHYPFVVELCRTPNAGGQPPQPVENDDLKAAEAIIAKAKVSPPEPTSDR